MRYEVDYDVYYSGPLMASREKNDTRHRKVNGLLKHPPLLYVNTPIGKYGLPYSYEISWEAAEVLAPTHVRAIFDAMAVDRDREWAEYKAKDQQ